MIEIFTFDKIQEISKKEEIVSQIKEIFYQSSSLKEFSSEERKIAFFKRWCGDYLSFYPEHFQIMYEDNKVLGYLSGCLDSTRALNRVEVPGFSVFSDLFNSYPAHFHINFHPDCRGRGLGGNLVEKFCNEVFITHNLAGVHLVTSPEAPNVNFYKRLGFNFTEVRAFNQMSLLFMGKKTER